VRFDSLNNRILEARISEAIPHYEQIRDLLVTDSVKNLFLLRHAESEDNVLNRIGGDAPLTARGRGQAERLGSHFRDTCLPYIFCSGKRRTIQTSEPICRQQQCDSIVISLAEFDEIDSGVCEGMSYQEIKEKMPDVYMSRLRDKYNYIYPQGEGYVTMRPRIDRGIKKALFLSGNAENVAIIGHRAVNRMILSHFLYRRMEDVPYIYVPLERYYHIVSTQQKKLFELKWFTDPGEEHGLDG
jgi:broad specificity phosphatase PhoE